MMRKPDWLMQATAFLAARQDASFPDGLIVIESPFAGDVRRNRAYLRACLRDSLNRGEYPYASHRMFTDCLDDRDPMERELGIRAGLRWARKADATAVYADLGISRGMALGIHDASAHERPVVLRYLRGRWANPGGGLREAGAGRGVRPRG